MNDSKMPRSSVIAGHRFTFVSRRSRKGRIALALGLTLAMPAGAILVGPVSPARAVTCAGLSGSGTLGDPHIIATRANLESLGACISGGLDTTGLYFKQTTSIDLSTGGNWTPISGATQFSGTYDGQGCSITNMTVAGANGGLFGYLRGGSVVQNLKLTSVSVTSPGSTGALAAGTASNVGGVGATVRGVVVSGSVSGSNSYVGGVIGDPYHANLTATHVAFTGSVTGTKDYVGGLFGNPMGAGTVITESYASGTVSGTRQVGGLFGHFKGSVSNSYAQVTTSATATSSQSTGQGEYAAAGLIAHVNGATIENSYATGVATGGGIVGAGSVSLATSTPTLTFDFVRSPLLGLSISGSGGTGSIGTGAVLVSGSGPYVFTATGASDGTVTAVSASGVNSGFVGRSQSSTYNGKNFFNSTANPTPNTGILTTNNTSTTVVADPNLSGKSTADMQLAATYTGWSSSIWTLADGSYPTLTWFATGMPTCPGSGGGTPAPPAPAPPAPAPEPSATATPTPTPTTSTTPTSGLDPIPNQVNPNVPASGVPQGGSVYLVDGTPAAVTIAPNAPSGATSLEVTGPDFFMKLSGVGDDADPLGLTPKNALILQSRQTASRSAVLGVRSGRLAKCVLREPLAISSGNGFKANSPVKMYILPATYIGTLTADDTGAYQGSLPIPPGVLAGSQTLQANGFAPSGAVRSLSLGILVKRGRTVVTKSERANVFFDPMSPVISPEGKAKLDVLVKRATRYGVRTVSLGFVQETPTTSNDQSLSTQRARNVAAYLRSRGLAGTYVVRGDGIAGPGATARRVNVTVSYQTGC